MMIDGSTNDTTITYFIFLGFQTSPVIKNFLSCIFSVAYAITILENTAIIVIVRWDPKLHTPMYFFLTKLSCLETLYVSVTIPKLLIDLVTGYNIISVYGCLLQLYFFLSLACTECFLLAAMAYDRYFAICNPMHYNIVMTSKMCWSLACGSLCLGFLSCSFSLGLIAQLYFCGPNVINHYLCDISPVIHLSCEDISIVELVDFITALFVLISSLVPIILSYIYIISTVKKITSNRGLTKMFSTCVSHLTVVVIFFGTTIFMYARPKAIDSFNFNKYLSVLYSFIIPMMNPVIYTLRNNELKMALNKMLIRHVLLSNTKQI